LPIWLLTIKSQKFPWLPCVKVACDILLESSQRGLQLCFRPHLNWRFAHKVTGFQNYKSPNFVMGIPNESPKTKWYLGVGPVAMHKIYNKGEGGGFPKSMSWWVLWVRICPWLVHAPKVFQLHINQLVWFVHVCVSNWLLVNLPSPHSRAPSCPSTPEVLWTRERAPTLSPSIVFIFGLVIESIKGLVSALVVPYFYFHLKHYKQQMRTWNP
jgi:hypothetical protein